MSERREKKKRYNQKLEYIAEFEKWLQKEPPMIRVFAWHKWKKQMIEQMPEAEEMYAAEFHFSGFFIWNHRTATDCHFAHTPELEQQLRNLCPHARWVDYSDKWL
jgi:hypothetical protein